MYENYIIVLIIHCEQILTICITAFSMRDAMYIVGGGN